MFGFVGLLVLLFSCNAAAASADQIEIDTTYGPILGAFNSSIGQALWLGIPYAAAPVGNLRFAAPVPPVSWTQPIQTTNFAPSCMADPSFSFGDAPLEYSENCLVVNVVAPWPMNAAQPLPVLVWIYGGGFIDGASTLYPPFGLVSASVQLGSPFVFVSMNYRTNLFGFLALEEENGESVANAGILDQRAALQWVQQNIGKFGGDPSRVTIAGESAGGASVSWHLLAKKSWPYFNQAILESPGPWYYHSMDQSDALFRKPLDTYFNCSVRSMDLLTCLRAEPAQNLLDFVSSHGGLQTMPVWGGISDLPQSPSVLWSNETAGGSVPPVRVMVGSNLVEGNLLASQALHWANPDGRVDIPSLSSDQFKFLTSMVLKPAPAKLLAEVLAQYSEWTSAGLYTEAFFQFSGDYWITCGARSIAQRAETMGATAVFRYQFRHATGNWLFKALNCTHTSELDYVFQGEGYQDAFFTPQESDLAKNFFAASWASFVSSGIPASLDEAWPSYDASLGVNAMVQIIDLPESSTAPDTAVTPTCPFWSSEVYSAGY